MAPAEESDESGEDEAGDALSAAYAALRRLRWRREGRGEGRRAEAEAAVQSSSSPCGNGTRGVQTAQKTVVISVVDVPVLFSDKFHLSMSLN